VARSSGGYRLYDAASVARLELIRTLRELGLGLDDVRKVLAGETTVAEVAAAHVTALDAQISSLKVTRAVLSSVARRGSTAEEMTLMNKLARLSAAERKRIMEEFVEELFHGLDSVDPAIQERMRSTAVDLPQEPTPEQVDAWVELAEMVQDPEFRAQMRTVVEFNAADQDHAAAAGRSLWFPMRMLQLATEARARGIAPESPEAAALLREVLGDGDPAAVLARMESASNDRLARYRELLSTVKGAGTPSAHRAEFGWVVAALRAGADR
jgi:DNA-binding transcriptional MerR regulator